MLAWGAFTPLLSGIVLGMTGRSTDQRIELRCRKRGLKYKNKLNDNIHRGSFLSMPSGLLLDSDVGFGSSPLLADFFSLHLNTMN